jgi:hypothetical protein
MSADDKNNKKMEFCVVSENNSDTIQNVGAFSAPREYASAIAPFPAISYE